MNHIDQAERMMLGCDIDRFRHLIKLNPFAAQLRYEPLEANETWPGHRVLVSGRVAKSSSG